MPAVEMSPEKVASMLAAWVRKEPTFEKLYTARMQARKNGAWDAFRPMFESIGHTMMNTRWERDGKSVVVVDGFIDTKRYGVGRVYAHSAKVLQDAGFRPVMTRPEA